LHKFSFFGKLLISKILALLILWRTLVKKKNGQKRAFNVVIERDADGYFVASVPELQGCHTQAKSLDTLMKRVREAIELCIEEQGSQPNDFEFVGVQRIAI